MKVKVGNKIYDGVDVPIMVILTEQDKENIKNMIPTATRYAIWQTTKMTREDFLKWMEDIN